MNNLSINIIPSCDYKYTSSKKRPEPEKCDKRAYLIVSDDFKAVIVKYANDFTVVAACKKFNKCNSTVTGWRNKARRLL